MQVLSSCSKAIVSTFHLLARSHKRGLSIAQSLQSGYNAPLQVMSLVMCPTLLDHPKVTELYPADAIARAKQCLSYFSGGLGAYTDSRSANRPLLVPLICLIFSR